jgi:5-methylcytosine-specific restriction endonuclease McrA
MAFKSVGAMEQVEEKVEWMAAHEALSRLAKRRAADDAHEGRCLLAALRSAAHVHLGFGSFGEYVERLLGYKPRSTQERLRVAEALESLPLTTRALDRGELHWSCARELTRVAVAESELAWLEAARGKTVHQLEALVAGKSVGDGPSAPSRGELQRHVLRFEVAGETLALFREAMNQLRRSSGGGLDDDSALLLMARHVVGRPRENGRASYQIALSVCPNCGGARQQAGGQLVPVGAEIAAMAACDSQHWGLLHNCAENDGATANVHGAPRASARRRVPPPPALGRTHERHYRRTRQPDDQRGAEQDDRRGALPAEHLGALPAEHLGALPAEHLGALPAEHLGALPAEHPGALPAEHLGALPDDERGVQLDEQRGAPPNGSAPHTGEAAGQPSCRIGRQPGRQPHASANVNASAGNLQNELPVAERDLDRVGGPRAHPPSPSSSSNQRRARVGGRAKQTITPATRRAVLLRDQHRCTVPGCRNALFVDLHHIELRSEGGGRDADNLITVCAAHHRAAHRGELHISGSARTGVRFRHSDGSQYGAAPNPHVAQTRAKVFLALRGLGFRERDARRALDELLQQVVEPQLAPDAEHLLRAALARLSAAAS